MKIIVDTCTHQNSFSEANSNSEYPWQMCLLSNKNVNIFLFKNNRNKRVKSNLVLSNEHELSLVGLSLFNDMPLLLTNSPKKNFLMELLSYFSALFEHTVDSRYLEIKGTL